MTTDPAAGAGGGSVERPASDRIAGASAIAAGISWIAWALLNSTSHRALELSAPGSASFRLGVALTVAWNLLLVPAALRLRHALAAPRGGRALALTASGILSVSLWSFGALTRVTHTLEFLYLALASVWLFGLGLLLPPERRGLARFTLVVAAFTALDAVFNRFEPLPFLLYALAAPKLPLSALWSVAIGITLLGSPWRRGVRTVRPRSVRKPG